MPADPRFPAGFDSAPWDEDIARTSPAGRKAAQTARESYQTDGVPRSHLKPCEAEGRDGTNLPDCVKVYLPQPDGRFGMIFTVDRQADKPALIFLAFGVRHHPRESNAPTVYEIAGMRLNATHQPETTEGETTISHATQAGRTGRLSRNDPA